MGFYRVEKKVGAPAQKSRVSVALKTTNQILISISGDVFALIGSPAHVDIYVGEGDDAGAIRVSAATSGAGYKITRTGASYKVSVGAKHIPEKFPGQFPLTPTSYQVTEDGLIVALPTFAQKGRRIIERPSIHQAA